jgi:hypothetical protein
MIVVIQCAASKTDGAGFLRTTMGTLVVFVADPPKAPASEAYIYRRPDDPSDQGPSWRDVLLQYNKTPEQNPLGLLPAFELYENRIYGELVERFGLEKTYILSAGWGLINARFLTPYYDITFSPSAEPYKRRRKTDNYRDLCMLPAHAHDEIIFFGGKDYLPLFCSLTSAMKTPKRVFYNSKSIPSAPGCSLVKFETNTKTNWHYECAKAFLDSKL